MRNIALWLHIMGAGTWIGANLTQAAVSRRLTSGDTNTAHRWLEAVNKMSGPLYGTVAVVILATGLFLVLQPDSPYSFGSTFVLIGIVVLIIGGALAGAFFTPQTKKAMSLFAGGNAAEGRLVINRIAWGGTIDTLLIAFAVLAMVSKWGA